MREQFEKLPEIAEIIESGDVWWSEEHGNYFSSTFEVSCYISGAWYVFQELNKPKKIDKLEGRIDEVASIGVPQGYKLVPVEPTKAMQQSAFDVYEVCDYKNYHLNSGTEVRDMIYKAMIGAVE